MAEGYRLYLRHVDEPMRVMARLLREGRDATGLRDRYARAEAHSRGAT